MPIQGLVLFGNSEIVTDIQIEGRIGYEAIMEYYRGLDASIYLMYNLLPPLYLIGGVNFHSNEGQNERHSHISGKSITTPVLGGGINVSSLFSFELSYLPLLKNENWVSDQNLSGIIKASFKFRWQL